MATKDYLLFTARDFALDEDFQQWVQHPGSRNAFWERWLAEHPEKKEVTDLARQLLQQIRFKDYRLTGEEKEALWERIWEGEDAEVNILQGRDRPGNHTPLRHTRFLKYAAAMIAGMLLTTAWWWWQKPSDPLIFSTYTRLGEVKSYRLPDSSEVTLNAGSRLLYSQTGTNTREIWIDGEAYFHVKHTTDNRPFIVHTYEGVEVTVLGTRFDVSSFGPEVSVVLQQGSVSLKVDSASLLLRPGEILRYHKEKGTYIKSAVNADSYTSWHTGRLAMDDYSLTDAARFMQQVFGKNMVVNDPKLLNRRISGSMPITYQADTMLLQFEKIFRVKCSTHGNDILVLPANSTKR